jgi:hypothetical protein
MRQPLGVVAALRRSRIVKKRITIARRHRTVQISGLQIKHFEIFNEFPEFHVWAKCGGNTGGGLIPEWLRPHSTHSIE